MEAREAQVYADLVAHVMYCTCTSVRSDEAEAVQQFIMDVLIKDNFHEAVQELALATKKEDK